MLVFADGDSSLGGTGQVQMTLDKNITIAGAETALAAYFLEEEAIYFTNHAIGESITSYYSARNVSSDPAFEQGVMYSPFWIYESDRAINKGRSVQFGPVNDSVSLAVRQQTNLGTWHRLPSVWSQMASPTVTSAWELGSLVSIGDVLLMRVTSYYDATFNTLLRLDFLYERRDSAGHQRYELEILLTSTTLQFPSSPSVPFYVLVFGGLLGVVGGFCIKRRYGERGDRPQFLESI
jgi:hypothetical protein